MPKTSAETAEARQTSQPPVFLAESVAAVRAGLESIRRGEGKPIVLVLERIRTKHKIPAAS